MKNFFAFTILMTFISCQTAPTSIHTQTPKNIILMIGDGMGLSQISSAFYFQEDSSNFSRFQTIGLINTSSTTKITDSAAGATAFSTGVTTYNGAISVNTDTADIKTIVEILSEKEWKTGVVSTSTIQHATPAAFYAHNKYRGAYEEITVDLINSEIDFFSGGGYSFFTQRKDSVNLLNTLTKNGFEWDTTQLVQSTDANKKYGFLLTKGHMPPASEGRGDYLVRASSLAMNHFSSSQESFFLMIEGSQIDWGGHDNNGDYVISEMIDFDATLGAVLDFAEKDGNTLVIVTADHETGGFTLASGEKSYDVIEPSFSTTGHSAALVPVFAFGPGSERFSGIYQNTKIFDKMMEVIE